MSVLGLDYRLLEVGKFTLWKRPRQAPNYLESLSAHLLPHILRTGWGRADGRRFGARNAGEAVVAFFHGIALGLEGNTSTRKRYLFSARNQTIKAVRISPQR